MRIAARHLRPGDVILHRIGMAEGDPPVKVVMHVVEGDLRDGCIYGTYKWRGEVDEHFGPWKPDELVEVSG